MTDFQIYQRNCDHLYGPWQFDSEHHNNTEVYKRVCPLCLYVDKHIGKMPPDGYKEPEVIINPAPAVAFKDKISYLVNVASALVKQKPGMQVVYIAGKVTGLDPKVVKYNFNNAALLLRARGFITLNPIDFIAPDENWQIAMRMASTLLMMADHIYLLPNWRDSEGAKVEFQMAAKFGINTITIE